MKTATKAASRKGLLPTNVVERLNADLKQAATLLTENEIRFLVNRFYQSQEDRKRTLSQALALEARKQPNILIEWLGKQDVLIEARIKTILDIYTEQNPLSFWARTNPGIGPIISAALLAYIDINKCQYAGNVWSYAGQLEHQVRRVKGEKINYNPKLKMLCWKIGESFVYQSGRDDCVYGKIIRNRKQLENYRNDKGQFAEQAKALVEKVGKDTEAYKWYSEGKLPPAHIHSRSKRYGVRIFLAHYFEVGYEILRRHLPPEPYPISILGHDKESWVGPPNWPLPKETMEKFGVKAADRSSLSFDFSRLVNGDTIDYS